MPFKLTSFVKADTDEKGYRNQQAYNQIVGNSPEIAIKNRRKIAVTSCKCMRQVGKQLRHRTGAVGDGHFLAGEKTAYFCHDQVDPHGYD